MHPTENIAVRAARQAGRVILRYVDRLDRVTVTAKDRNDFVSDVDREAEDEIIRILRRTYPDHSILAEEGGRDGESPQEWIIDPLDGTTNFLHGFPQFAVSIAFRERGRLESAVVYDPLREEMFTASRGAGAQLNGKRIRVNGEATLNGALLGTGFPFKYPQHRDAYLASLRQMMTRCSDVRRAGSAALDLAYVAGGRMDGFWEVGLRPWDLAAGTLLVREAGGLVSDFGGGERFFDSGNLVAAGPRVFREMLKELRASLPPELLG